MRNITATLVALLLATACSSAPSASSALSGQPTTPALNAPSTPTPPCASVTVNWAPVNTAGLLSFSLASKAQGGGWMGHGTHPPDARSFTIDGLVSGSHLFQILAVYDNRSAVLSRLVGAHIDEETVGDCPVVVRTIIVEGATPVDTSMPSITTTTRPHEPKPKCAEAIAAEALRNPVAAILPDEAPEYGPGSADYMTDTDGDGLIKWQERLLGTNPQDPDTDDDGFSDGLECFELDSDPLDPNDPGFPEVRAALDD